MNNLVAPHGGTLLPLLVSDDRRDELLAESRTLPRIPVSSRELSDLIMLGTGSFSPLSGFMKHDDYRGVLESMRLADGTLWPIPVTLAVNEQAAELEIGQRAALIDPERDEVVAVIRIEEKYPYDKAAEAQAVFGSVDSAHPGVQKLFAQGDFLLGGPVEVLGEGVYTRFPEYARPAETRAAFIERGWTTVAAFQTRNPIHRSHEYLTKVALEICDGILIHPLVGRLKEGDIPAEVRMRCYQAMMANYYPAERVMLKVYPLEMRYAGPKEAVLHAIIRQNFGCSHMIVGRDHAGVGRYYEPFAAQEIFDTFSPEDLQLKPIKMDWTFWCRVCESIVSSRTCPHPAEDHLMISGTELRGMLARGEAPPREFTRPEVAEILMAYYRGEEG